MRRALRRSPTRSAALRRVAVLRPPVFLSRIFVFPYAAAIMVCMPLSSHSSARYSPLYADKATPPPAAFVVLHLAHAGTQGPLGALSLHALPSQTLLSFGQIYARRDD